MPQPLLNDVLVEYSFDPTELIQAKILTQLQIYYLSTMYAQYMKLKAAEPIPEDINLTRTYICKMAELDGKMGVIQELIDNHKQALQDYNSLDKAIPTVSVDVVSSDLQARAASHLKP